MSNLHPSYYSGLDEWRETFDLGIPILNYHMVAPLPSDGVLKGMYIPPESFQRQLQELTQNGYTPGSLDWFLEGHSDLPSKKVILTFDDGFQSVHRHAMSVLNATGWKAIQYLVSDKLGKSNEWDLNLGSRQLPIMTESEVRDWIAAGHTIGSHTQSHPYLTRLSEQEAREELTASKKSLEDRFGVAVRHFCYPYGDFNDRVMRWAQEAGYDTACTVERGVNGVDANRWMLKRIKGRHPTRKLKTLWKNWLRRIK